MFVQGVGGAVQYPKGYLKEAYKLVRERGGVCIADEVGFLYGRFCSRMHFECICYMNTQTPFECISYFNRTPDIEPLPISCYVAFAFVTFPLAEVYSYYLI